MRVSEIAKQSIEQQQVIAREIYRKGYSVRETQKQLLKLKVNKSISWVGRAVKGIYKHRVKK